MMRVWETVLGALDRHGRAAMVTLAATRGSSPREAGARLIVNPDGTFSGTIGGGTLEWKAIAIAQAALANPSAPKAEARGFALGPELGQCCGGNVELIVELIELDKREAVTALAEREAVGSLATRGRLSASDGIVREIVADGDLAPGSASYRRRRPQRRFWRRPPAAASFRRRACWACVDPRSGAAAFRGHLVRLAAGCVSRVHAGQHDRQAVHRPGDRAGAGGALAASCWS